jgi:lipid-binding SYLF domain-containing protein
LTHGQNEPHRHTSDRVAEWTQDGHLRHSKFIGLREDKDPWTVILKRSQASRQEWNKVDPQLEAFAKKGYGYAFFPEITKGGLLVGGAHGRGVVYEKGQHIGYADLTQMSAGFQAGLQDYSQLIVFENQAAMDKFKRNEIDFSANASAVLADKGAAASAQFVDGVAVFVRPTRGAMRRRPLAVSK